MIIIITKFNWLCHLESLHPFRPKFRGFTPDRECTLSILFTQYESKPEILWTKRKQYNFENAWN